MKKTRKILSLALIAIILMLQFVSLSFVIQAQAATTGSIQIFKYGMKDLSGATTPGTGETMEVPTGSEPLEGVEFTIYKVSDTYTDVNTIPTDSTFTTKGTTDADGMVQFSSLELGRYLVVESNTIDSVSSKSDNFLVDIPMTNADGSGLIYDVKVYPKNQLVVGNVTLNAYDSKTSEKVDGAEYILNVWDETQSKYVPYLSNGTEVKAETVDGQFVIDGLTIGKYCFIGTAVPTGYLLDDKTEYPFEIKKDDLDLVVNTTIDPILTTTKSIDNSQIGSVGNSFTWNIAVDVPEKTNLLTSYIITDTMSTSLTYESLELKLGETVLDTSKYSVAQEGQILTITVSNPSETLSGADSLTVNVVTKLNSDIATVSATNSAKLEYTYNETPQDTDESEDKLSVGTIKITKTNSAGEVITTGATFEIYTNKEGTGTPLTFINAEGTEATTVTTGVDGIAYIKGLATGTYYLKETAAPEGYNLPTTLKEVKIESDGQVLEVTVVNKTGITLPNTGTLGTILCAVIGMGLIAISIKKIKK